VIPLAIAFEDALSESVISKVVAYANAEIQITLKYHSRGFGNLKKNILAFNNAAKGSPHLVLTDLDRYACAPELIGDWMGRERLSKFMLFRVACVEVESWLLADRHEIASFFGVSEMKVPIDPDTIEDGKVEIFKLARQCRRKGLKKDILPRLGSRATIGPGYNDRLCDFVERFWMIDTARKNSDSLARTIKSLERLAFP
jgi:hypothetical protein